MLGVLSVLICCDIILYPFPFAIVQAHIIASFANPFCRYGIKISGPIDMTSAECWYNEIVPTIFSLKYAIVIGTSKLFDNDKRCITISKLLNQCEQMKIKECNKYLNKIKAELNKYGELKDFIGLCRDKMYAHTDKVFNQKNDKFEYTLNETVLSNLLSFLNWTLDICVEISILYDQDKMCLKMDRNFQLSKE